MKRIITLTLTFLAINLYAINVEKMPRTIIQPDSATPDIPKAGSGWC